ncbi:MAG: SAM-dependent DNA methyltransferase [Opitutales bacterium]|nr:SAM-dependent DNA methyltransferase [Opitutales bacterium]
MTRSEIKSKIDALWLDFHSGGITNPITVIEQISQPDKNDLPDLIKSWTSERETRKGKETPKAEAGARSGKCFRVPGSEIRDNKYDLSLNRYKETQHEEAIYDPPKVILQRMRTLEHEILADIDELEGMLK